MKLELKHIKGYLDTKLKGIDEQGNQVEIVGVKNETYFINSGNTYAYGDIQSFKPILRPLSDLTKEIKNGTIKFIPAEVLFSVDNSELEEFRTYGKIPEYWKDSLKVKPLYYDFYQVQLLFEWHFDVFGLIEKGLAIDINNLKN